MIHQDDHPLYPDEASFQNKKTPKKATLKKDGRKGAASNPDLVDAKGKKAEDLELASRQERTGTEELASAKGKKSNFPEARRR